EPLGAHAKILDTCVDLRVQVLVVEILHPLEGVDHAADRLSALALLIGREQKGVDELVERAVVVLQLELDATRNLRKTFVERIEFARRLDLLARELPFALRKIKPAE